MVKVDKETRFAIQQAVKSAVAEAHETYTERWMTGAQLSAELPFFTREWLKRFGSSLPRERVGMEDAQGRTHYTGWCYPYKKILRMIAEGKLRQLKASEVLA